MVFRKLYDANVQQNVPIIGTLSGTNGLIWPKCTVECPYSMDAFWDKRADLTQMYNRMSL